MTVGDNATTKSLEFFNSNRKRDDDDDPRDSVEFSTRFLPMNRRARQRVCVCSFPSLAVHTFPLHTVSVCSTQSTENLYDGIHSRILCVVAAATATATE